MFRSVGFTLVFLSLFQLQPISAWSIPKRAAESWSDLRVKSFVAFGDSYTDESRLGYFIDHDGDAPPAGTVLPLSDSTSSGGYIWARYATWYFSQRQRNSVSLYDYAVSGAVCSNEITPRFFESIHANYPDIEGYEMPAFYADSRSTYENGTSVLDITPDSTVYAMWIGTNDLGEGGFLQDRQVQGKTIVDYLDCVYRQIDSIHANPINGRYLVLMNMAPLQNAPMYQLPEISGLNQGYLNATATHYRMEEQVLLVNEAYEWRTMGEVMVQKRYPGMKIAVFDMYTLMQNIYENPSQYLNGTAPANVDGFINHCNDEYTVCVRQPSPDSYEWFDPLHPSEQTDRIIAEEFVKVVQGSSDYAMYFS